MNKPIVLYHGSDVKIKDIDLSKGNLRSDFGKGFYLADKLDIAQRRAVDTAGFQGTPVVTKFELDPAILTTTGINVLQFRGMSADWMRFVKLNSERKKPGEQTPEPRHTYDAVSGPIADDKVATVMIPYCKGNITDEEAMQKIKAFPGVYQLSLHTPSALHFIRAVSYQQKKNDRWSNWTEFK